jgi:hypothetical protein
MSEHSNSEVQSPTPPKSESSEIPSGESCEAQAPSPPMEQIRYWERDLFYKKLSLFISLGGFLLIIVGLGFNIAQSHRVEKSIRANVQNSVLNHVLTLDKLFMEKPYLIPYFYEGKPIDDKDEKYQEVAATAEMILDIFDLISVQNKSYLEFWDSPEAWDEWVIDTFSTSPILRDTLDRRSNWYDKILVELRKKGQQRLEEKGAKLQSN